MNILPSNPRALGYEYPGRHRGRGYALDGGSRKSIGLTTQWREGSFYVFFFYLFTSAVIIKYWSSGALARFIKSSWRVLSLFIHSLSFSLSLLHRILSGTFTIFIDSPPNHLTTQTNVIHETKSCLKNIFSLSPSSSSSFLYQPVWHIQSPTLLRLAGEISCSWVELCISLITTLPYHLENSLPPLVKKNFIIEWINDDICRCAKDSEHLIIIKDDQSEGKGKKKKKKKKKNLPLDVIHDDDGPPPLKILSCKYYVTAFVVQFITTNPNLNPTRAKHHLFSFPFLFPPLSLGSYICAPSLPFLLFSFFFILTSEFLYRVDTRQSRLKEGRKRGRSFFSSFF